MDRRQFLATNAAAGLLSAVPAAVPSMVAPHPHQNSEPKLINAGIDRDRAAAFAVTLPASMIRSAIIEFDTIEAMRLISQATPGAKPVSGETAIWQVRLMKTDYEIAAISHAAPVNREAAHLAAGSIRGDGTAVLTDCVSSRHGYKGDYGLTVFIGEPREAIAAKAKPLGQAWPQLQHELRPGMIISVDCPLMQVGHEGTGHLEDLMVITDSGAQPIHSVDDQIIIV